MSIMSTTTRIAALYLMAATCALAACSRGDENALQQDSALSRDLARAGTDSQAQPELKDVPPEAAPAPAATNTPAPRPRSSAPKQTAQKQTERAPAPPPAVTQPAEKAAPAEKPTGSIAAGAILPLNSTEKVCTNTNKVGDRFTATVREGVDGSNGAAIPAGSKVVIEVTQLHRSTNANDKIVMGFRVVSLTIGDKTYYPDAEVETASVNRVAAANGSNTTKKVIGGAVAGAIIGQIIGRDRKGTLIGAAAGAAAGGAAAAATADHDGCVNDGAAITVKITQALMLPVS
jgi:YMGG-like Gly-zipper